MSVNWLYTQITTMQERVEFMIVELKRKTCTTKKQKRKRRKIKNKLKKILRELEVDLEGVEVFDDDEDIDDGDWWKK